MELVHSRARGVTEMLLSSFVVWAALTFPSEAQMMQSKLDRAFAYEDRTDIQTSLAGVCSARQSGNKKAESFARENLKRALSDFTKATGRVYHLPPCEAVLPTATD